MYFIECEIPIQQQSESDNKALCSPRLSTSINKTKPIRSTVPVNTSTQTGLEVRCKETQTDRLPGPGFILAEYQDYLRRYSMEEVTPFV